MDQLLEPQLVDLVDDDEQRLIVLFGAGPLRAEDLAQCQIGAVVESGGRVGHVRHSASQLYAGQAYIVPGVPSIEFAELTTVQADRLLHGSRAVVLLLPIAAVEPHGPHAPLATDGLIASGICERAARALEGDPDVHALVLPPLAYGVTRYAAAFRGAVGVTQETLRLLVTDIGRSLIEDGFRRLVLVNHHFEPEHIEALRAAR